MTHRIALVVYRLASLSILAFAITAAQAAPIVDKTPDLGNYWFPLSSIGTYVYANSFIAPGAGSASVNSIGIWLNGGSSEVKFQILADNGNSPDGSSILTSSSVFSGSLNSLTLVTLPVSTISLISGQRYWVAASTVGLGGSGYYNVGGHTQNSGGIVDNGSFWYSNDPSGQYFDGQGLTPEMAFQLNGTTAVPAPGALAVVGLNALALVRRRRKA